MLSWWPFIRDYVHDFLSTAHRFPFSIMDTLYRAALHLPSASSRS